MSPLTTVFVIMFILSTTAEARIKNSVTVDVQTTDFSVSKTQVMEMLAKANLTSLGYQKEEIIKLFRDNKTGKEVFTKAVFYFKVVNCSQSSQIIHELKRRLPGILKPSFFDRVRADMNAQKTRGRQCKTGIKILSEKTPTTVKKFPFFRTKRGEIHIEGEILGVEFEIHFTW